MAHRYWNADSDLDYYLGNAPPEEAPQDDEEEPMSEEMGLADEATAALDRMIGAIDEAIPSTLPEYWALRAKLRKIALDYGDARGATAVRNANAIWSRYK